MKRELKVFSSIFLVKGYERGMIYDVRRGDFYPVPNSLITFANSNYKENDILDEIEQEYVDFLFAKELAYFADSFDLKYIKQIELTWDVPYQILNLEIDCSDKIDTINTIIDLIVELRIPYVNFIVKNNVSLDIIKRFILSLKKSTIITLSLYFFENFDDLRFLNDEIFSLSFINKIIILKENKSLSNQINNQKIYFADLNEFENRFNSAHNNFNCSLNLYTESEHYNTYFNKKLFIGPNGEIKNAFECETVFGNINQKNAVEKVKKNILTPEFQKYWTIKKDRIDICKDCEFRRMCVDNRLPYQRSENEWFNKLECNYNPYICKWKGEKGYKPLKECGVISNKNGFMIDHEKIAEINASLWLEMELND